MIRRGPQGVHDVLVLVLLRQHHFQVGNRQVIGCQVFLHQRKRPGITFPVHHGMVGVFGLDGPVSVADGTVPDEGQERRAFGRRFRDRGSCGLRRERGFRDGFIRDRRIRRRFRGRGNRGPGIRTGQDPGIVPGAGSAGDPDPVQVQPDGQPQAGYFGIGIGAPADMAVKADQAEFIVGRVFDGDAPPGAFSVGTLYIQAF